MVARLRGLAVALAVQVAVLSWGMPGFADESVPADRRLPQNAVAYVSFRSISELRSQWAQTLYGQLSRDDSLGEFRKAIDEKFEELSRQVAGELGVGLADLLNIPHGELAAAVTVEPDGKLLVSALLDFGKSDEAVRTLLDRLAEKARDNGVERVEDEVEDTKVVLHRRKAEEGEGPAREVAYCVKDTFLVVGNGLAALKSVLSRWDGKSENVLAENSVYRYVVERSRGSGEDAHPLMTWYLDPMGLIRAAISSNPQAAGQAALFLGMLPTLGVDKLKAMGGSFDLARGEYDMVSRTLVYIEPPARGVLNLFQFDPAEQAPPRWVGADVAGYFMLNWNLGRAYAATESLVDMFQGPGALNRLIQQLADNEQSGNVHLKKDVIDQLSGKVHVVSEPSAKDDDPVERYLVAAELKNAPAAKATLRKLTQIPGVSVKERDFQGETVYELASDADEGEDGMKMGFAITEGQLMFATDVKLLERVLRGSEGREALADSASFRKISARFPEKTSSIGYNRQDNDLKSMMLVLKSPAGAQVLGADLDDLFSKLPPFEALKKYMPLTGSYMEPDERGMRITSFSLKKD